MSYVKFWEANSFTNDIETTPSAPPLSPDGWCDAGKEWSPGDCIAPSFVSSEEIDEWKLMYASISEQKAVKEHEAWNVSFLC